MAYISNPRFAKSALLKAQQEFAKRKFGVKAHFKDSPEAAAKLIRLLSKFKKEGFDLSRITINISDKQLGRLNDQFIKQGEETALGLCRTKLGKSKGSAVILGSNWFKQANLADAKHPLHIAIHEIMHALNNQNIINYHENICGKITSASSFFRKLKSATIKANFLPSAIKYPNNLAEKFVSKQAGKNGHEFIAEYGTKLATEGNSDIPEKARKLLDKAYKEYFGPEIKKPFLKSAKKLNLESITNDKNIQDMLKRNTALNDLLQKHGINLT